MDNARFTIGVMYNILLRDVGRSCHLATPIELLSASETHEVRIGNTVKMQIS